MTGNQALTVRQAEPRDIPRNREIQEALFPGHPYPYADNVRYSGTLNFVAIQDGQIIGFTSALIDASRPNGNAFWERARPYIAFVGVIPSKQRSGVGSALLTKVCEAIFATPGSRKAYLECERAQAHFYEKNGFVEVAVEEVAQLWGPNLQMRVPFRVMRR